MAMPDDLTDLLDSPSETLAVEYKSKLDLSDARSRANLARHVAALANHGGGYLVFGFDDDLTRAVETEFSNIDRDAVAGIVKYYLDPPFQCEVRVVAGQSGARHTIVVVPSHGSVPICARRDGPQDAKGRPQGIVSGAYYIRKPGPASEQIVAPSENTLISTVGIDPA
jgi:predicted HTH transcriptional regulator